MGSRARGNGAGSRGRTGPVFTIVVGAVLLLAGLMGEKGGGTWFLLILGGGLVVSGWMALREAGRARAMQPTSSQVAAATTGVDDDRIEMIRLSQENDRLRVELEREKSRPKPAVPWGRKAPEDPLQGLEDRKRSLEDSVRDLGAKEKLLRTEVSALTWKKKDAENEVLLEEVGLYDFENPAEDSVKYGDALQDLRMEIKARAKAKRAVQSAQSWTVNGSQVKGRKMVSDMSRLLLRAYNAEAENAVKSVKAGNLDAAGKRVQSSHDAVARLGSMMSIRIDPEYHRMRLEELRLTHKHMEAVKAAKEFEREERARAKEEAEAQREMRQAKEKQLKEVMHYESLVEQIRDSQDEEAVAQAEQMLEEAREKLEDVESTIANVRAGYVYVLSNPGSFGEGVVKIGMTRRLNPEERVRELGSASVPFRFSVHAMIFSKDAVGLENRLHKHFGEHRVNLVNMRKEYFHVDPHDVKEALVAYEDEYGAQMVDFREKAAEEEYLQTLALREGAVVSVEQA